MLVLANEIFDSPPDFAWVLPVFVRLKPGKEETFFSASLSRIFCFYPSGSEEEGEEEEEEEEDQRGEGRGSAATVSRLVVPDPVLASDSEERRRRRRRGKSHRKDPGDRRRSVS